MKPYNQTQAKGQQIEQMFNSIALHYDLLNNILSLGIDNLWRRAVVRRMAAAQRVVDVATGTADMAIALAKAQSDRVVTGIDISEGMLAVGRQKSSAKGLDGRIELICGAAESLPFADGSFDAATVAFGVRNFDDLERGIEQMCRVVRVGGRVVVLEFSRPNNKFFGALFRFYFHKIVPLLGGLISGDRSAYDYLPHSVDEFPSPEGFAQIMQRAGCSSVEIVPLTFGVANIYIGLRG